MRCDEARLALLDADLDELRADDDGELAAHLRGCAKCAADAAAIIVRTDALREAVDQVVAAGEARHASHCGDDVAYNARGVFPLRLPSNAHALIRPRALIPLAAAAGLAALVLIEGDELRMPFGARTHDVGFYVPQVEVPDAPVVNASGTSGVAVMRTTNPDITVVWNF